MLCLQVYCLGSTKCSVLPKFIKIIQFKKCKGNWYSADISIFHIVVRQQDLWAQQRPLGIVDNLLIPGHLNGFAPRKFSPDSLVVNACTVFITYSTVFSKFQVCPHLKQMYLHASAPVPVCAYSHTLRRFPAKPLEPFLLSYSGALLAQFQLERGSVCSK